MKPSSAAGDQYAQARLRLLDLAEDASLYLRRSAEPSVRVAAALLLAASLAACSSRSSSSGGPSIDVPAIPPLNQEIREGLPMAPGTYPVSPGSVTRDAQGVYGLSWRNPTGAATWSQGRSSLMKLAQGNDDALEIPSSGDPILRLKPDTAIALPDDAGPVGSVTPTPRTSTSSSTGSSSGNRSIAWYPFFAGGGTTTSVGTGSTGTGASESVAATTPAYRNPPAAEPGQGSVRGSSSSLAAPTTSARTWTSPSRSAATGQAGGPGGGTAASSRAGTLSGPASGAARPSSAGFSGGKSGASSSASSSSSSG